MKTEYRNYVKDLCGMLDEAVKALFPDKELRMQHAISGGYYCQIEKQTIDAAVVEQLRLKMAEIIAAKRPDLKVFDLKPYAEGMLLLAYDEANPAEAAKMYPQPKLFAAFERYTKFNEIFNVRDVKDLNALIERGWGPLCVRVMEAMHNNRFGAIARDIADRFAQGGSRVVLLAGPSSSGKTTSSYRLGVQLYTNLVKPCVISLDDYYVPRDRTPLDEFGEKDYESLYALDLDLFNDHLCRLLRGEEVSLPTYNFNTGKREYHGNMLRLGKDNLLLLEGIHGLNPELTRSVSDDLKYRVFASALTTLNVDNLEWISTTDNRLLRRMVRDYKFRSTTAQDTLSRWPSVRRGERKWIEPFQENADETINTSLIFEIAALKADAERLLKMVPADDANYAEAQRLMSLVSKFRSIGEQEVPDTSLLREFLGGSVFIKGMEAKHQIDEEKHNA